MTRLAADSLHGFSIPASVVDGRLQSSDALSGYAGQLVDRGVILQHAAWALQEWEMAVRSERPDRAEQARAELAEKLERVSPDGSLQTDQNYVAASATRSL